MQHRVRFPDGPVELGSDTAAQLGFTADKFEGYLWILGDWLLVSMIVCKFAGRGDFRALVGRIHELGYTVKVPTPLGEMRRIVEKNGYRHTVEYDDVMGAVDVWVLPPPKQAEGDSN